MEVWVLEWSQPVQGEANSTVWLTQEDAQRQALKEIRQEVTNDWDINEDQVQAKVFNNIESYQASHHYAEAISAWNEYQMDSNSDYSSYWNIYERPILTGDSAYAVFNSGTAPGPYQASQPGATCRGHCKQFNEYAYADKTDGTHLCHQCRMFQGIFTS